MSQHQGNLCTCFKSSSDLCQRRREIEIRTLCKYWETGKVSTKFLNGKLNCRATRKTGSAKIYTKHVEVNKHCGGDSDVALYEIHPEFASQRFQLQQANQWADRLKEIKKNLYGELELRSRFFQECQAKYCQEIEELSRVCCEETDRARQGRIDELSVRQESYDCESIIDSNSGCTEQSEFFYAREIHNPVRASSSGASLSTLDCSESQGPCLPAILDCHDTRNIMVYFRKCFRTTACPRGTILYDLRRFTEFGIVFCKIETYCRKYKETGEWNETRTAKFVNTCTTLPKWIVKSYWWNLFSHRYDWFTEIPDFAIASGKISWLYGISKLTSQLQKLKYVQRQQILISQCTGSKKLR